MLLKQLYELKISTCDSRSWPLKETLTAVTRSRSTWLTRSWRNWTQPSKSRLERRRCVLEPESNYPEDWEDREDKCLTTEQSLIVLKWSPSLMAFMSKCEFDLMKSLAWGTWKWNGDSWHWSWWMLPSSHWRHQNNRERLWRMNVVILITRPKFARARNLCSIAQNVRKGHLTKYCHNKREELSTEEQYLCCVPKTTDNNNEDEDLIR